MSLLTYLDLRQRFIHRIDDDTVVNYESLAALLKYEEENHRNEKYIYCPSVMRNQKVWTHSEAPILGKWAYDRNVPNATFLDKSNIKVRYEKYFYLTIF